jgi:hypothetical protein
MNSKKYNKKIISDSFSKHDSLESDGMISGEKIDVGSDYTGRIVWFDEEMLFENLQVRLGDVLVDAYQVT